MVFYIMEDKQNRKRERGRTYIIKIKAPAKINLTLDVTGRRNDGYHNLEMVMQTVSVYDELEISILPDSIFLEETIYSFLLAH